MFGLAKINGVPSLTPGPGTLWGFMWSAVTAGCLAGIFWESIVPMFQVHLGIPQLESSVPIFPPFPSLPPSLPPFLFAYLLVVPETKHRALCFPGNYSVIELHLQPQFFHLHHTRGDLGAVGVREALMERFRRQAGKRMASGVWSICYMSGTLHMLFGYPRFPSK